jgi:hypothetical protein
VFHTEVLEHVYHLGPFYPNVTGIGKWCTDVVYRRLRLKSLYPLRLLAPGPASMRGCYDANFTDIVVIPRATTLPWR